MSSTLTEVESDSSTLVAEIKGAATSTSTWDSVTGVSGTTSYVVSKPPTPMLPARRGRKPVSSSGRMRPTRSAYAVGRLLT